MRTQARYCSPIIDGHAAAGLLILGWLLAAGAFAVLGPAASESPVGQRVHGGLAYKADRGGVEAAPSVCLIIRSKDNAEINTPLPKAIIEAVARRDTWSQEAGAGPISSAAPATSPQKPACSQSGIMNIPLVFTLAAPPTGKNSLNKV